MLKIIKHKIRFTSTKILATLGIVVAIFVYGFVAIKSNLKLTRAKNDIQIEIIHTPRENIKWIYVNGNSPEFTTGSLIQSEGLDCAVIHRLVWRNVPRVGILEVEVNFKNNENKNIESITKMIILGAIN